MRTSELAARAAVRRVRFIKREQELGFSPAEVATLLDMAEETIANLRRRIADLQALQAGLTRLVATCALPHGQRECPILHELDPGTDGTSAHRRRGQAGAGGGRDGG